jgi:Ni/Co efflux regulator RcnB
VADYAHHGLRKPGRGNEWRRIDDRYVLIAIATGLVVDIASGR